MVVKFPFIGHLSWLSGAICVLQGAMYFIVKMKARLAIFEVRLQRSAREDDELLAKKWKTQNHPIVDDIKYMPIKSVYYICTCWKMLTWMKFVSRKKISPAHSHAKWDSPLMPHSCRCWIESLGFSSTEIICPVPLRIMAGGQKFMTSKPSSYRLILHHWEGIQVTIVICAKFPKALLQCQAASQNV